jgi:hypothetical protein
MARAHPARVGTVQREAALLDALRGHAHKPVILDARGRRCRSAHSVDPAASV